MQLNAVFFSRFGRLLQHTIHPARPYEGSKVLHRLFKGGCK